jgi:hypothetical protein
MEQIAIPAQHGVRLDAHQRYLPCWQLACQQRKQGSVAPSQCWTLHLTLQHKDLLAQKHVFQHQFRLAACQVHGRIQGQTMVIGLCPSAKTLLGCLVERIYARS